MALTLEDMMDTISFEETTTIHVQLLTGVFPVRIRMSDQVSLFAKQCADQFRINPRVVKRMRFYLQEWDEWDEDTPLSGWMTIQRMKGTWRDIFQSESELPSCLFMVINDDPLPERMEKLKLIHYILQQHGLAYSMNDTVLYGEYLQWFLYSDSPDSLDSPSKNRYELLSEFVRQRSHLFTVKKSIFTDM